MKQKLFCAIEKKEQSLLQNFIEGTPTLDDFSSHSYSIHKCYVETAIMVSFPT